MEERIKQSGMPNDNRILSANTTGNESSNVHIISNILIREDDPMQVRKVQNTVKTRESIQITGDKKVNEFENILRENYAAATSQDSGVHNMDIGESNNDDGFRTVNNKRKRTVADTIDLSSVSRQDIGNDISGRHNRFELLGDLVIEEEQALPSTGKVRFISSSTTKKETFCPPIFLFNVNIPHLIQQLNAKNIGYKIVNKNKWKSKLYLNKSSIHSEMMAVLRKGNIESYSYTPKDMKRVSIVLRGLHYKTELDEIKTELEKFFPNTVENVSKFTTEFSRKQQIDTGLFLVTLCPGKSIKDLCAHDSLLNQRISWERPKINSKIPQCWRCQQWGHMSKNCNRTFVCVKCDEDHLPGKCKFVSSEDNLPYCANCGERGHPSSYRGCRAYATFLKRRERIKEQVSDRKRQAATKVAEAVKTCGYTTPGQSFASLFQTSSVLSKRSEKPPIIMEFLKLANTICSPLSLEERIENFIKSYKSMSKEEAVSQCLKFMDEIKLKYEP